MAEDAPASTGKITFTEGESTLLISIMQHLTSDIQFDADAIATQLGYKNGSIVKTRWNQVKNKKLTAAGVSPGGGIKKRAPVKKATPKKAQEDGETNNGGDDEEMGTPTKTPAKRGRKSKAEMAEKEEGKVKEDRSMMSSRLRRRLGRTSLRRR